MPAAREFRNRRAFYEYHVLEKVEAGLALIGSEVKSLREGSVNFADSYARVEDGEVFLVGCHIAEYKNARAFGHEPTRRRKLLLHRCEIRKLGKAAEIKGHTLVPLRIYFNKRGFAKVEIGVCRGKKLHDKRLAAREKETEREIRREMSRY
jgi:SsrA-binding protein